MVKCFEVASAPHFSSTRPFAKGQRPLIPLCVSTRSSATPTLALAFALACALACALAYVTFGHSGHCITHAPVLFRTDFNWY